MRRRLLLGSWVLLMVGSVALAPGAGAACHAFEVDVEPNSPTEGASVEVTVSRDAAVNPSSVRVRTVDQTATAGQDYEAVDRMIRFTADTEQTFTVKTLQDSADEPNETFRIALSEGGGCQINPNFSYGEATVTIEDDDEAGTTTTTGPPAAGATTTTTARGTTTTVEADEPTTTTTAARAGTTASTTTLLASEEAAAGSDDDDDGGSAAGLAVGALLIAVAAGGGYWLFRTRFGRPG